MAREQRYEHLSDPAAPEAEAKEPDRGVSPGKIARTQRLAGLIQRAAVAPGKVSLTELMAEKLDRAAATPGRPLPEELRRELEAALGVELGAVRLHTSADAGAAAKAINASAYTVGQDVYFADGRYDPASPGGKRLIAHEVAHTVQQRGPAAAGSGELELSTPGDALEREADAVADAAVSGRRAAATPGPQPTGVSRQLVQRHPGDHEGEGNEGNQAEQGLTSEQRQSLEAAQRALEPAQQRLRATHTTVTARYRSARGALQTAESNLNVINSAFEQAWSDHVGVLQLASAVARQRQEVTSAVLATVSLVGGLPGVMELPFGDVLRELNTVIGRSSGQIRHAAGADVPGAVSDRSEDESAGGSLANIFSDEPTVRGMQALDAAARLLALAEKVLEISDAAVRIGSYNQRLASLYIEITQCLRGDLEDAEAREALVSRAEQVRGRLEQAVTNVVNAANGTDELEQQIVATGERIAEQSAGHDHTFFERKIWIDWIAHLQNRNTGGAGRYAAGHGRNADVLDENPIENHLHHIGVLGPDSDLGVDFGAYTTDADENEAVDAARLQAFDGREGTLYQGSDHGESTSRVEVDGTSIPVRHSDLPNGTRVRLRRSGNRFRVEPLSS